VILKTKFKNNKWKGGEKTSKFSFLMNVIAVMQMSNKSTHRREK